MAVKEQLEDIGAHLKRVRTENGVNVLAFIRNGVVNHGISISRTTYDSLEAGRLDNLTLSKLEDICQVAGFTLKIAIEPCPEK
jgi:hypothetical protein